jgi:catechol 2,3-dioxygenase-like lactoylglutathione lyase family enzyme
MSLNVSGTDFILIQSSDLARTEQFYTETLGLEFGKRWGDIGFEVETGDTTLAFMDPKTMGRELVPSNTAVVLRVDDVPAAKAELETAGVEFQTDVIDSGSCHQAYFADPDGNALGIHHIYASRTS